MTTDTNKLLQQIVDKVIGGGGSGADGALQASKEYTDAVAAQLEAKLQGDIDLTASKYVGTYPSIDDLEADMRKRAITPQPGSWAIIDDVGIKPKTYQWDATDNVWATDVIASMEPAIRERKYAILPIAGQSNALGYGETPYQLQAGDGPSTRVFQLGRYITGANTAGQTVSEVDFGYDNYFTYMRPFEDCNLQIIPAAPCLDHVQNMFQYVVGGTTGYGLNLAKKLLRDIPEEYDILIVPCACSSCIYVLPRSHPPSLIYVTHQLQVMIFIDLMFVK